MKRNIQFIAILSIIIIFSSCVTKQKYMEMEKNYRECQDNLTYTTAEKWDFKNQNEELTAQVSGLQSHIIRLLNDTLSLSRSLRQLEREYAKSKSDYDALLKNFVDLNLDKTEEMNLLLGNLDSVKNQLEIREKALNEQTGSLEAIKNQLLEKETRLNELQEILSQKDAEVKALKQKVGDALTGFAQSGLDIYEKNGKVYVSVSDKLLFASGSWTIGTEGEKALKELALLLEKDKDINVLIEGHTDNVPYKGNGQVKDNWDLSVMRATSVVKILLKYAPIEPQRISASGRSEYLPLDTENTLEAKAKNRRTEIILTPKLDQLFQIIESN